MNYLSGEQVQVGDNVLIENGRTSGVVEHIIETTEDMKSWNLHESGLLLASPIFGSVFWPIKQTQDPVVLVSRSSL